MARMASLESISKDLSAKIMGHDLLPNEGKEEEEEVL